MRPSLAGLTLRSIRWRLFLSCWMVFVLHFATDFAREHYLVLSIAEDHSFRLDKYYGMHVDIFQNPPNAPHGGAHHGANPGISMVAAIPYFLALPAVNAVVNRSLAQRTQADTAIVYKDDRWRRVEFYTKIRKAGLDLRFGLASAITQVFCMAPLTAASVVVMLELLLATGLTTGLSLGLAFLYAFGTPVFFRTAYLNQNLAIAVFEIVAFLLLWNPGGRSQLSVRTRLVLAGLLGGLSLLSDYSGGVGLAVLGVYALIRLWEDTTFGPAFRTSLWYAAGAMPGILLLWYYQWASFGDPFHPPQHWMAPVEWIDVGYKGVSGPTMELFRLLLIEPRYGLFITMPAALLALAAPWLAWRGRSFLQARETWLCLGFTLAYVVFFSAVQYTRLQYVTGIRYLAPVFPFIFLPTAVVLVRLPRALSYAIALLSVTVVWCMSMVRSQGTVFENVERVFVEGLQLPWLTVLGKLSAQYLPWLKTGVNPIPLFLLLGVAIWLVWTVRLPWTPLTPTQEAGTKLAPEVIG